MKLHLLIAEPRNIYRKGFRSIFDRDPLIASIEEAATIEELTNKLVAIPINAVIANQSLITDVSILPESHVMIVATQPDQTIFSAVNEHGLNGYFLDEPDEDLLRKALHYPDGCCLLDPRLTLWALHWGRDSAENMQEIHFTPCEREIQALRERGLTTSQIAQRRSISQTTVKKHLQNAARKLRKR
ncbi:MAG: helix-turn-helix transcriptional regulator [Ktedonobacteraceae bacterium]